MTALIDQAYLLHMPKSASVASRTRGACKTLSTGAIYAMMTMPGALLIWRHCKPIWACMRCRVPLSHCHWLAASRWPTWTAPWNSAVCGSKLSWNNGTKRRPMVNVTCMRWNRTLN